MIDTTNLDAVIMAANLLARQKYWTISNDIYFIFLYVSLLFHYRKQKNIF